ncbi:TPA: helix-turn-helix domain containing protein [Clostridioides difficile]|nr:helix-turn-helix domain containing protein [Clostridioides difficile]HBF3756697.1 helix-turn-helix domain containing protein [Clostridioides difficile]HBF6247034.1 helix-turn-helix domain containing protein [Clostridioides difficile]HBY3218603.1 helix-turn-helix domain containing protein [Clostridioides difficile]
MSIKYNDKRVVLVNFENIDKLNNSEIEYIDLEDKQYYVVHQGKKNKRFTDEEVKKIKNDLDNGLSIRKAEQKYNCGRNTIMKIKKNEY